MKKFTLLFAVILLSFSGVAQETEKTEIDWEAFRLKVIKASEELERERKERLRNRYTELFEKADSVFHVRYYCPCVITPNKYSEAARKAQILTDQKYYQQKNQN